MSKSSVDQIRQRFDQEVERFSNLETGQLAAIDSQLSMELIAQAASRVTSNAIAVLDIGCGAGNYTLKLLEKMPGLEITLIDLSRPMLNRALERISQAASGVVTAWQGDIRDYPVPENAFDIVLAAAVFHHLREEGEWRDAFSRIYAGLRPGGSLWISDLVQHSNSAVQTLMWERYGAYLAELKDDAYRDRVFDYIELEDSPRSVLFQVELLREVGFAEVDLLHKNSCFATFGAIKR